MEIPVYIFSGFLDAGKTTFIQGALEDERFNDGEKTLVLMCEEGEIELQRDRFSSQNVFVEMLEEPEDISPFLLSRFEKKYGIQRVMVEYNGMWPLSMLIQNLPNNWVVYQQYTFIDATTFLVYNGNMRQQTVDKIAGAEMIVFNRSRPDMDIEQFHRLVRALNRRCDILYEYEDGSVVPDTIEDPLPFDVNADLIVIKDEDYAVWYREVSESPELYVGKKFKIKGMLICGAAEIPEGNFICGRQVMTCCVEDIQFAGFMCEYKNTAHLRNQSWGYVTAELQFKYHSVYRQKGPVLSVKEIAVTSAPKKPIATF
ncbi:MAG: hypothetical protein IKY33_03910 [Clostridia bacterium]|nr:hypothetical protein [Clostridia bacterium]